MANQQDKRLKLLDITDYIDDNQTVKLVAYNIPLYCGACGDIPVKYSKYPMEPQKITSSESVITIHIDC